MEKDLTAKRTLALTLTGMILGMSLICGYSEPVRAKENQEYNNILRQEQVRTLNSSVNLGKSTDSTYDVVYSETLKTGEKNVSLKILLNTKDCTDGMIQIDQQDIAINSELAKTVGYAHAETKVYDFNGDGKEEIALVISGGASGAFQAVQVFGNTDGKWNEIKIPSVIYDQLPKFVKKQQKELGIKIEDSVNYYRTVSFEKEKIFISYQILSETGTESVGEVKKELSYSSDKKQFVLGDTLVIPAKNKTCTIEVLAKKKAIKVKWSSGAKKSSIKGVQIKVATKKNMKGAKTYKFGKENAQKMSYLFTVKNGKISNNKTYYVKVRLKAGNKWTKWSNVEKAKVKG